MALSVLLAIGCGVLSISPTTGTVSAWAEPPLEHPATAPDEAVRPESRRWEAGRIADVAMAGGPPMTA